MYSRKRKSVLMVSVILLIGGFILSVGFNHFLSDPENPNNEICIFAAASLKDLIEDLGEAYKTHNGKASENGNPQVLYYNFAGSNTLAHQIVKSSQADIFVSANEQWMDYVDSAGQLARHSRRPFLSNTLVVVSHRDGNFTPVKKANLCFFNPKNLVLADPDAVPAGQYAKAWMQSIDCEGGSLWDRMKPKIIPALDARAALYLVKNQKDMPGIVYKTDVIHSTKVKTLYEVSKAEFPLIRYSIAKLKKPASHGESPHAQSFLNFLESPRAGAIFERHGFIPL